LVLAPVSWRLRQRFFKVWRPPDEQVPDWLPAGSRHWFWGEANGLPFLDWPRIEKERLYLLDPSQFSLFKTWSFPDGQELEVTIKTYDPGEALHLARDNPKVMQEAGPDPEARALEIRQHALINVREKHEVEVTNRSAARAILLPAELQDE
jgi:hypothetical protein